MILRVKIALGVQPSHLIPVIERPTFGHSNLAGDHERCSADQSAIHAAYSSFSWIEIAKNAPLDGLYKSFHSD